MFPAGQQIELRITESWIFKRKTNFSYGPKEGGLAGPKAIVSSYSGTTVLNSKEYVHPAFESH